MYTFSWHVASQFTRVKSAALRLCATVLVSCTKEDVFKAVAMAMNSPLMVEEFVELPAAAVGKGTGAEGRAASVLSSLKFRIRDLKRRTLAT